MTQSAIRSLFAFLLFFSACKKNESPGPSPTPVLQPSVAFAKGADVSWLTEMESAGRKFYNSTGGEQDLFTILKSTGMNTVRLRVWENPSGGWNSKADVVAKATRATAAGMRIMIDFHYSDSWADPGKQTKPTAWGGQDISGLKLSLASHTTDVLNALKSA